MFFPLIVLSSHSFINALIVYHNMLVYITSFISILSGYLPLGPGAGHGGEGGNAAGMVARGSAYDSFDGPAQLGSGGDNTRGGGALKLQSTNTVIHGKVIAR